MIRLWRHALYSFMHRQSDPSLFCAGSVVKHGIGCCRFGGRWNLPEVQGGSRESHAPLLVLPGKRAVQVSVELVGPVAVSFLDSWLHTVARTGIPPAGCNVLSLEEFKCLLNCLWCCAADGTTALAREYRGLLEAPHFAFDHVQAERSMITPFSVPSAPVPLPRSLRPRRRKNLACM